MSFFKTVTPIDLYSLHIVMATGSSIKLDLSSRIETTRFCPLKDPKVFLSVTTDGEYLIFNNKIKIGASEVMDIVMLPRSTE